MHRVAELASSRGAARLTSAVALAAGCVAAVVAPRHQQLRHYDHIAYEATIRYVRGGEGLYQASVDGLAVIDVSVDQVRALRQPWMFEVWAAIPQAWLLPVFFAVVVVGSTLLAVQLVRWKPVALAVGGWLASVGVFHGVDAWLLFELWAVPLVLLAAVAHVHQRPWLVAACCVVVVGLRETAVLLPLGFLADAVVRRRPPWPYLAALATSAVVLGVHYVLAQDHLDPEGRSATLAGTGDVLAIGQMTSYLVTSYTIGLLLWGAGLFFLWRSQLRPMVLLALIPLSGLLVNRPYWGLLAMPLCLVGIGGPPALADEDPDPS